MPYRPDDPHQKVFNLPPGQHCSVGLADNTIFNKDGEGSKGRPNEDKYFTCSGQDNKLQVYMVLDGHDGSMACEFVQKHLPLILLDCAIRDDSSLTWALRRSFNKTEEDFFKRIDGHIGRRMALQFEMDQKAANSREAMNMCHDLVDQLGRLDEEIRGGTTAVVAAVFNNKLFIANCGDSRAVLCHDDPSGKLATRQLSVDHNTSDEGEIQRLAALGLDPHSLREGKRLGTQQNTRSIGDYFIKGGYTNVDSIAHASREPGTAEPFVSAPIDLAYFNGFLILMSDGLYKAYEAWTKRPSQVNEDIGYLVAMEIKQTPEFHLVAQNVVQKVVNVYLKLCKTNERGGKIDDITLIVRNFGYPPYNDKHPSVRTSSYHHQPSVPSTAPVVTGPGRSTDPYYQESPYPYKIPDQHLQSGQGFNAMPTHQGMRPQGYNEHAYPTSRGGGGHFQPEPGQEMQHNDWRGFYPGPVQPQQPYTGHPPPLESVQSYPHMTLPHPRNRQQSIPSDMTRRLDDRNYHTLQSTRRRQQNYENTEIRRTDQRHFPPTAEIEARTQAMHIQDPPVRESPVMERRNPKLESSPNTVSNPPTQQVSPPQPQPADSRQSTYPYTPVNPSQQARPMDNTTPKAMENTAPELSTPQASVDQDEDFELYGWRMDKPSEQSPGTNPKSTSNSESGYDTLKEGAKPKGIPPQKEAPASAEVEEEDDEEILTFDPSEAMDLVPPVEDVTDGEAKCYVRFPDEFPKLNWDDIPLED